MKQKNIRTYAVLLVLLCILLCSIHTALRTQNAPGLQENAGAYSEALQASYTYTGSPCEEVNGNRPFFTEEELTKEAFETYSPLDGLGRCGAAYANVCTSIMPTEERGEIGSVKPSGWHTVKYKKQVEGSYLYNRCHLIAYVLAGENANERNLITGTRYMNVEGMLPFESQVADYVRDTDNHVLYRVTPVFTGRNLVADGVLMEAYSVEDDGAGVCFCVFAFNVQPGIVIDYATGESQVGDSPMLALNPDRPKEDGGEEEERDYVLNTNTHKFHDSSCPSAEDMRKENRQEFHGTREELIDQGFEPCGNCKP